MKLLILARYGQWENGHLNAEGIETMNTFAERIKILLEKFPKIKILSADIPRAYESAKIIAAHLNIEVVKKYSELYAAEEEGLLPNVDKAYSVISSEGKLDDVVVVVVSREYTKTLPNYISNTVFDNPEKFDLNLNRGEAILFDFSAKKISTI